METLGSFHEQLEEGKKIKRTWGRDWKGKQENVEGCLKKNKREKDTNSWKICLEGKSVEVERKEEIQQNIL